MSHKHKISPEIQDSFDYKLEQAKQRVCCANCKHWQRYSGSIEHLGFCSLQFPPYMEIDNKPTRYDDTCSFHA